MRALKKASQGVKRHVHRLYSQEGLLAVDGIGEKLAAVSSMQALQAGTAESNAIVMACPAFLKLMRPGRAARQLKAAQYCQHLWLLCQCTQGSLPGCTALPAGVLMCHRPYQATFGAFILPTRLHPRRQRWSCNCARQSSARSSLTM